MTGIDRLIQRVKDLNPPGEICNQVERVVKDHNNIAFFKRLIDRKNSQDLDIQTLELLIHAKLESESSEARERFLQSDAWALPDRLPSTNNVYNEPIIMDIGIAIHRAILSLWEEGEPSAQIQALSQAEDEPKLEIQKPHGPRLGLDEDRKRFRIDDTWYDYTGQNAATVLAVLLKAEGKWENASHILPLSPKQKRADEYPRVDRVVGRLPDEIKAIIESERGGYGGGYRIKPEYFPITKQNRMKSE